MKTCPDCLGDGENDYGEICETCNGEGKVPDEPIDPNEEVWQT